MRRSLPHAASTLQAGPLVNLHRDCIIVICIDVHVHGAVGLISLPVIPARASARDSGFGPADCPGMTEHIHPAAANVSARAIAQASRKRGSLVPSINSPGRSDG